MLKLSRMARSSRYTPVVGCAFLVEMLYGSKYSANLGLYNMPYVYVKTILLCATGHSLMLSKGRYIRGLVELLLPSKVSQDNLTKLELLQFVDAIPVGRYGSGNNDSATMDEDEAEKQAMLALMMHSNIDGSSADTTAATIHADDCTSSLPPLQDEHREVRHAREDRWDWRCSRLMRAAANDRKGDGVLARLGSDAAAEAVRSRAEELEEDAVAMESIMSFVSATMFPSSIARVLIYDAVCTCMADGLYRSKEKERVTLVSSHIGLSSAVRGQIEKLALQEKVISIRKRRLLLLHPFHSNTTPMEEERRWQAFSTLGSAAKNSTSHERGEGGAGAAGRSDVGDRCDQEAEVEASTFAAEEAMRVAAAKALLRRARARRSTKRYAGA
ncbi:conserved hypothetical protein [Leishmania braziliensis MHOM/BR/75/M2904]|uniref:Uncharacterized protein n=2 Tax=Leishmania braziliensis TaxID=5660 RepID=A4HCW6_LEIBR|nr:conserved hypothetical protein [Leishmania braziliensis MHOM/BR/75/M2904]KAI5688533.1 hypothetical protein MNV84_04007 [Leishmania braziliensis]CAJ2473242.1 unnamed protein product [Leishmania braziliensis]CAJ2473780.1 unnamed protein product [Leishmania braziliensis]CAM36612.1 conserved hypothetical protein [Leishmania braziliensis MHOM/BR/75/M2904]